MITGQGGFVHRIMPPTDWNHGPIPQECYNPSLGIQEIEGMLLKVYLEPERVRQLADSDDPWEIMKARNAIEINAHIDAGTIWGFNLNNVKG